MDRSKLKNTKIRIVAGAVGVAAVAGSTLCWHRHRDDRPYGPRWIVDLPRPTLSRDRLAWILRPQPGERLLEIGPGYGYYTQSIAEALGPTGRLEILDVRQTLLDQTVHRIRSRSRTNVIATRGDAQPLSFPERHFDGAYLVACLGEISDPRATIDELARVLRPGGRLVVGETAADPHRVRRPELIRIAESAGLKTVVCVGRVSFFARFDRPGANPADICE